jgi:rhodanese-related sulfurtransferase
MIIPVKSIYPKAAWELLQTQPQTLLIDVRSTMEYHYVGHPIGAVHIPWSEPSDWQPLPQFSEQVYRLVKRTDTPVLLICRSGIRSLAAGEALIRIGFTDVYNVLEGFEGNLDVQRHRGTLGGWRYHGLPWEQE